jgi:hypothetical protein
MCFLSKAVTPMQMFSTRSRSNTECLLTVLATSNIPDFLTIHNLSQFIKVIPALGPFLQVRVRVATTGIKVRDCIWQAHGAYASPYSRAGDSINLNRISIGVTETNEEPSILRLIVVLEPTLLLLLQSRQGP